MSICHTAGTVLDTELHRMPCFLLIMGKSFCGINQRECGGGLSDPFRWVAEWGVKWGRSLKLIFMELMVDTRGFTYIISLNHLFLQIAPQVIILMM